MAIKTHLVNINPAFTKRFGSIHTTWLSGRPQIRHALKHAGSNNLWILPNQRSLNDLAKEVPWPVGGKLGNLVALCHVDSEQFQTLSSRFRHIVFTANHGSILPLEQLLEVLSAENSGDLVIAGLIDWNASTLMLWRGDFSKIVLPLSAFAPTGTKTKPDFKKFSITDYGQTLKFGDYEASVDAVLYEYDPEYRRRLNNKRRDEDKGFGASLRRLRLQKQLRRTDFLSLSEKTIARIERGEVANIHPKTKRILAKRLGVAETEIESY